MAATNYTPIQLYYSTTASAAPLAANLMSGELGINITDGKLYYKDNGGVVQVIATKGAGTIGGSNTQIQFNDGGALAGNAAMVFNKATNVTTLTTLNLTNALGATYGGTAQSAYTQGDILYASATNTLSKLTIGTVNYILTSTGSVPQWVAPTSVTVQTANNLAGGVAGSVPYQSAADTTTFLAIGAANRVMTSTGSAPQWVTSLTGLTGVSSSAITNTALTSGRLVYSTTGGAQTDSANLTFDGTTLSATGLSTTGASTLVKLVKVGDSAFTLPAVLSATAPAKLYVSTATVTDGTSAGGATNTLGTISAFGSTTVAATNASVTYTNLATLYIAGAPTAGTNVTITNPYALYVAGGASYFGGAVTYGAGMTLGGNLLFSPDNTYNIGATGGTNRPANIYVSASVVTPYLNASTSASSNTGPSITGVNLSSGGVSSGYYSPAVAFDVGGGGGGAKLYTTRLSGAGGRFYINTDATNGTSYNRLLITEAGEWYWYNNNVTTGAQAMQLVSQQLTVSGAITASGGKIESLITNGLVSNSDNVANNGIYWQIRPYAGKTGYLTFTENSVADRWAIGIEPADGNLYFRAGQVTATAVARLSSTGKLALASSSVYSNANLTIPWGNTSAPASVIWNIDTLYADQYRGAFGDFQFRSSSSFANNGAQGTIYLAARNYNSAAGTANDITQGVGLWIRGYYDNSGAGLPIYLGGSSYGSTTPAMIINQSSYVGIGSSDPAYKFDVNFAAASSYVARILNSSGSTSSDNGLYVSTSTASSARTLSVANSGTENFNVIGAGQVTAGAYNASASTQKFNVRGNIKIAGAQSSNIASLIWTRTDASWAVNNETDLRFYSTAGDSDSPATLRMTIQSLNGYTAIGSTNAPVSLVETYFDSASAKNGITVTNGNANAVPGYIAFKGYDWVRSAIWNDRVGGNPLVFAVNPNTSDLTVNGCATVGGFNTGGSFYAYSAPTAGGFQGKIIAGNSGSLNSFSGGGGVAIDTGIAINQISGGGCMLFLCSVNTSAGLNTTVGVYMIQFYYDGNNTPTATLISGSNSWTFGKSGSNTLTVTGPGGNNNFAYFGNK